MTLFYSIIPHLTILACTALLIIYTDFRAFKYFYTGKVLLSKSFISWSHRIIWFGLGGMLVTGFILSYPSWEYWIQEPIFRIKLGIVAMLFINAIFIGRVAHIACEKTFCELPQKTRIILLTSGGISAIGWISTTVLSFLFL